MSKELKFKIKKNKITEDGANIIMQNVRCTFVNLAKPGKAPDADSYNYEVTMLIPKKQKKELDQLRAIIDEVIKSSKAFDTAAERKQAQKTSGKLHGDGAIIKDGDKTVNKDDVVYDGLAGHWIVKAKTKAEMNEAGNHKPKIKFPLNDKYGVAIPKDKQADELYSGMWADIAINIKGYEFAKKKRGATVYLAGVMKIKNGERIGGNNAFEGYTREDVEEDEAEFDEGEEF